MTASEILFYFCIFFIVGIFLSSVFVISSSFIWAFLLLSVLLIIVGALSFSRKREARERELNSRLRVKLKMTTILGFCILVFCLGILRYQISLFNIASDKLSTLNNKSEIITLTGIIIGEPDNRDTIQRLKVKIDKFESTVLVTKSRYPEGNYLDKIKITGKLSAPGGPASGGKTPLEKPDFSYKNYLLKDGIYSVMDFPKTELILEKHKYNLFTYFFEKILLIKQKLRESIRQNYSPPQSLILEGTILGDSSALTTDLKNQLNITGLRHIIAVSGTHVVILCSILMYLFLLMGFWRGQAFYGSITFIWLYIILTGLPASGIRAGIMATIFLLAEKLGRQSSTERIITLAGAIILCFNPLLLIYDIGFQLSFLAVLGLIYLQNPITEFLKFIIFKLKKIISLKSNGRVILVINKKEGGSEKLESFLMMVSATISAQVFTLPIMIYNFGNISLIALVTNILILPIVEYLMIFGFLSSIVGTFSSALGFLISLPCYIFLNYFVHILKWFSQPWAMKTFSNVHWAWVVVLYFLITILVLFIKKKQRENKFFV